MANDLVLGIRLTADGKGLVGEVRAAKEELEKLGRTTGGAAEQARRFSAESKKLGGELGALALRAGRLIGTFSGLTAALTAANALRVAAQYEQLRVQLETVTGSAAAAARAFDMLKAFSAETPFQLNEVITAFTRLQAMGLDPSNEALRAYGNTAAAMGKSLMQMVEAVADAAVGEFERLKEFGIKAAQEGDRVTFTFRGISTTVEKSAQAIEDYLRRIGETEFSGGMKRQSETLNGALSNLSDAFASLFDTIGRSNLPFFTQMVKDATGAVQGLDRALQDDGERGGFEQWLERQGDRFARLNLHMETASARMLRFLGLASAAARHEREAEFFRRGIQQREALGSLAGVDDPDREIRRAENLLAPPPARTLPSRAIDPKAAEAAAKERQRLLDQDRQGWIAYIEEQQEAYEEGLRSQARSTEAFYAERDRLLQLDAQGWIAYIEQQQRAYEDSLRVEARATEEFYAERDRLLKEQAKKTAETARELGLTFTSAFEDAVVEGRKLSDVLKGIEQDLIRIAVRKMITEPLTTAASGFFESIVASLFPAGGGFLGSIFAGLFHAGGVVGEAARSRPVPAALFAGAPRLHAGGVIGPGEVPAILQRGETVLPRGVSPGASVTVNVINNTPAQVRTQERQERGERVVDVIIEFVKGDLGRDIAKGGPFSASLERVYGLNRAVGTFR